MLITTQINTNSFTIFLFCFFSPFSFGMVHDGEGNICKKSEGNIMSPTLAGHNGVFSWSSCSRQYLSRFLKYVPVLLTVK